jgi:ABC-type Na+ efflux pump permease subunit
VALFLLTLLVCVQIASQASVNLAEARHNGTLELLLSTPLKVRDIIRGQWMALRKMFGLSFIVLAALLVYVWLLTWRSGVGAILSTANFSVQLLLEFFVLGWVGMWSGLVSKTANGAFFRTIVLGLVVPFLVCTPTILNQVVLLAIAADKVQVNFRRFVAKQYLQDPNFVLPIPPMNSGSPPVIRN